VGDFLSKEEKDLFLEIIFNREAILSWDFDEAGIVHLDITPP
jgi:hypothetical protein